MRLLTAFLALAAICGIARADDAREEAIWTSAHNRFVTQMDRWFSDGDYLRCIQLLQVMHDVWPSDYGTTTDLGWMLQNVEQYDEALAIYKAYRLAYPNDPEAPYPEAEYYYLHKQYAKVPPLIEGTLAKKPHPNSFRILAHSYDHLGKLLDSRRVWKLLIATYPHEPAITTSEMNLRRVEAKIAKAAIPQ